MKWAVWAGIGAALAACGDSPKKAEFDALRQTAARKSDITALEDKMAKKEELAALDQAVAKKTDLTALEQSLKTKSVENQSALRAEISKIREEVKGYEVLAKKMEIQAQQVDDIIRNLSKNTGDILNKADTANTNVLKSLEIQEAYLKQLLESMRTLIEELKKK